MSKINNISTNESTNYGRSSADPSSAEISNAGSAKLTPPINQFAPIQKKEHTNKQEAEFIPPEFEISAAYDSASIQNKSDNSLAENLSLIDTVADIHNGLPSIDQTQPSNPKGSTKKSKGQRPTGKEKKKGRKKPVKSKSKNKKPFKGKKKPTSKPKLGKISSALKVLGPLAVGASQYLTSENSTETGKVADGALASGLDFGMSAISPLFTAVDAIGNLVSEDYGKVSLSKGLSEASSSITGMGESILTGNTDGIVSVAEKGRKGEGTIFLEAAIKLGDALINAETEDAVETVGDFYGGHDSVKGRLGAAAASLPGVAHLTSRTARYFTGDDKLTANPLKAEVVHDIYDAITASPFEALKKKIEAKNKI